MNHRKHFIKMLLAVAVWLHAAGAVVSAQDATVPVSVATVRATEAFDEIPLTGSISPWRSSHVSPRIEGYIVNLPVSEGDMVESGDILLELDPTIARIDLSRAQAEVKEAEVQYREAIRQRDEIKRLLGKKAVADSDVAKAESEVALYAAGVERLKAELAREKELLSRHRITAPYSGVITEKLVEIGDWVETSTDLLHLLEISRLKVEVPVPQEYFSAVTVGTPVFVEFDAVADFKYRGAVTTRIPLSDGSARTFPVHIEIDNDLGMLAPGMSARVKLHLNHSTNALILPKDAIVRDENGTESVWIVRESDGIASGVNVVVQSGRNFDGWIEVEGDLNAGDKVVVHGNETLNSDQQLEITEEILPAS